MSKERWVKAQSVEREHGCHDEVPSSNTELSGFFPDSNLPKASEDTTVLAIGAGMGAIHTISDRYRAIGIDPIYESRKPEKSTADSITGMGEHLPIRANTIDYLICHNVLDHVMEPAAVAHEMQRVLAPTGRGYVRLHLFQTIKPLRRIADRIDLPHPHHFTESEAFDLFSEAGLSQIRSYSTRPKLNKITLKKAIGTYGFNMRDFRIWVETEE